MDRKKLSKLIGAVTLGVLLFSQTIYASAYGNVNVSSLNIRAGAGTNNSVIGSAKNNEYIHILDKAADGWYAIETKTDQLGYISGQYVDLQKAKGVVSANSVNIRSSADYSAPVISQVHRNNVLYAYEQIGDWLLINSNGQDAYIHREFVDGLLIDRLPNKKAASTPQQAKPATPTKVDEKTIAVPVTVVNLRQDASTSSQVLQKIGPSTAVSVVSIGDEWIKVVTSDNTHGYMAKEYMNIGKESVKDQLMEESSKPVTQSQTQTSTGTGAEVVSFALQFLGNPYVYGGNSLTNGVDCSGFSSQVYKHFGVSLNRNSAAQYANDGTHVNVADVQPGDLMFYGYKGQVSHVAIYIGDGQVVQASTPSTGIIKGSAFRTSGKPLIGIKRVI